MYVVMLQHVCYHGLRYSLCFIFAELEMAKEFSKITTSQNWITETGMVKQFVLIQSRRPLHTFRRILQHDA